MHTYVYSNLIEKSLCFSSVYGTPDTVRFRPLPNRAPNESIQSSYEYVHPSDIRTEHIRSRRLMMGII